MTCRFVLSFVSIAPCYHLAQHAPAALPSRWPYLQGCGVCEAAGCAGPACSAHLVFLVPPSSVTSERVEH